VHTRYLIKTFNLPGTWNSLLLSSIR